MFKRQTIAFFLFLTLSLCSFIQAEDAHPFHTKFGNLVQDYKSTDFLLAGKPFLDNSGRLDVYGSQLNLSYETFGEEFSKNLSGQLELMRMVVADTSGGGCFKQFIVLDFSGEEPFISERFGDNSNGTACLKFIKAKWGKKESYITLDGPLKYIYYTGGKIFGPL